MSVTNSTRYPAGQDVDVASLGVMTTEFEAPEFAAVLDQVAAHGIDCVQLQLGSVVPEVPTEQALRYGLDALGPYLTEELASESRRVLGEKGIEVAAVDGTYNMAHPDPARRNRNLHHLLRLIELAPSLGTDLVTLCTGTRADMMWEFDPLSHTSEAWADLVAQVRVAAAAAEAHSVRLAFEPEHNNVVDSAHASRRLIDEVGSDHVKVLMDGANLFHRGDLARMSEHLEEAFALLGPDIALAHAKDLDHDGDAGGRAAGCGRLNYTQYLAELQACGFDGAIVLHQLGELLPDRIDQGFEHVRQSAPAGFLA